MANDNRLIRMYVSQVIAERAPPAKGAMGPGPYLQRRRRASLPPTGTWVRWSKNNPREYKAGGRDTGPGEEMIAWELGGATQGNSVSYDVVDQDGDKWEVKEPGDGGMIRPGVEGRRALQPVRQQLEDVCRQLVEGFDIIDFDALEPFAEGAPITPDDVAQFIMRDVPMITSGEISDGRITGGSRVNPVGLLQVLEFVKFMVGEAADAPAREITLGGQKKTVGVDQYVHGMRSFGVKDEELDATVPELFAGTFRHPAFRRPRFFIKEVWLNSMHASMVFPGVSGVIVVTPSQFKIITHDMLDDSFKFMRISKGEPRFALQD